MENKDLTKGPIGKQLWSLAWPMMLSFFFNTLYNIVDAYWVSKLSEEAIAAVSISQISLFIMISLGFGITVGSGVIMAMHIGARDRIKAERILGQSFVLSAMMAGIFTIVALVFRNELLTASGASGAIFEPAMEYYVVVAAGSVLLFLMMSVMFAFNSQGDTGTLTILFAISTAINLVLDPMLIFGWSGIPAMGISGAAIATLISQAVFLMIGIKILNRESRQVTFRFENLVFQWHSVKRVLRIGVPAALTQVIFPLGLAGLTFIASEAFQEPGAIAFTLGFRLDYFAFLPAVGFGFGTMAMISQNIGAGNLDRAREAFRYGLKYAFIGATAVGVLAAIFASPLILVFTDDPQVMEYASGYMSIVTLSYGFLAAVIVENNAFQAIGKSWPGFWVYLIRVLLPAAPLGYYLTAIEGYPIEALWVCIVAGNLIASSLGMVWIRSKMKTIEAPKPETEEDAEERHLVVEQR